MKKLICILFIAFSSVTLFAQEDYLWSLGLHHPLSIGDNFVKDAYNGIVGVDIRRTVYASDKVIIRVGGVVDYYDYDFVEAFDGRALFYKPRVLTELRISDYFKPFVNLGYGIMAIKVNGIVTSFEDPIDPIFSEEATTIKETFSGFNAGFGVICGVSEKFYITAALDFLFLNVENSIDKSRNRAQTINLGAGVNF